MTNFFRRTISWFIFRIINKPTTAARYLGAKVGEGCKICDDPWKVFGSEPYLVEIGDNVEITNGVRFVTHDGSIWVARNEDYFKDADVFGKIVVSHNVFIGINSIILPSSHIEENVIVGAGSIVKGVVESGSVVAGIPAKRIKSVEEYLIGIEKKIVNTHSLSYENKKRFLLRRDKNGHNT